MEGFQVTLSFKDGATPQDIAAKMRFQAGLFEGMTGSEASSRKNTDAPKKTAPVKAAPEPETEDDDEDFEPKKVNVSAKAKKAASFDEDEDTEVDAAADDEEEEFVAPAKKAKPKAKKITIDDVNQACKDRAAQTGGKEGRAEVLGILKKKFKTDSVSELEAAQWPAVIAAMQA